MPSLRCFIGLPLPGHCQATLERLTHVLATRLASRITWTRPENAHLTLKFLGDVPEDELPALRDALRAVHFAPFALQLGGAGCFPAWKLRTRGKNGPDRGRGGAPQVLWTGLEHGAEGVVALARAVDDVCLPLGFARAASHTPHLTLGRVREAKGHAGGGEDWGAALDEVAEARWGEVRVERFVLWRSILGPAGPKYAPLEEFPALAG